MELGRSLRFEQKLLSSPGIVRRHVHRGLLIPDTMEHVEWPRHSGKQRGGTHWHNTESNC